MYNDGYRDSSAAKADMYIDINAGIRYEWKFIILGVDYSKCDWFKY